MVNFYYILLIITSFNILISCYPNIVIFKIQNNNILKNGSNYLDGGLYAIDNINFLLESIQVDNIITINDNNDNSKKCLKDKNNIIDHYGTQIHEELILKKEPLNFDNYGFPILYNSSFIKFINNLNDTFILTGLEGEKEIDQASNFLTKLNKNVVIYLPGIVWRYQNDKNNTIEKMIKRKNIIIYDFDNKRKLSNQLLNII